MNNISTKRLVKISKFLSYHLRHRPDVLNLELAPGGWVEVDRLITAAQQNGFPINQTELKTVVAENDKRRFSFNSTETLIRANQGHSVAVDLQLTPTTPPNILYHGTHARALETILQQGLHRMRRHHVHLSNDWQTAIKVGERRGKAVVLEIDAQKMAAEGFEFYCCDNGVWLVESVPAKYIKQDNN